MGKHLLSLVPQLPHRSLWMAMVIVTVAAQACN